MKYQTNPAFILAGRCEIRLKMSAWHHPLCHVFQFGSVGGLLSLTPTTYEVVAVVNERPGNGTFAKFISHLQALAREHRRDLLVVEIHNPSLGQHLAKRYGFALVPGTRHAFLKVAGPGTVPEHYTTPTQPGPLDSLLAVLTSTH